MIKNFLIISCIGKDDKLGLRINKDFFVHIIENKKNSNETLIYEILQFLKKHNVQDNVNFDIIVNLGPGSFSGTRISLAVAKGLKIAKKTELYGFKNTDLVEFTQKNIEKLFYDNLIEKNLIQPIYMR